MQKPMDKNNTKMDSKTSMTPNTPSNIMITTTSTINIQVKVRRVFRCHLKVNLRPQLMEQTKLKKETMITLLNSTKIITTSGTNTTMHNNKLTPMLPTNTNSIIRVPYSQKKVNNNQLKKRNLSNLGNER